MILQACLTRATLLSASKKPSHRDRWLASAFRPLAGHFDPAAQNELLLFEAIERGVERRDMERDPAARPLVDQSGDLVAVAVAFLEQSED